MTLAGLLALAALVAIVRVLRSNRRYRIVLAALQPVLAALLFFALDAPAPRAGGPLVVLAAGATDAQRAALARGDARVVALPEASAPAGVERVPDLATALRRHAGAESLRIVGRGLDRATSTPRARGPSRSSARPPPAGLVELDVPAVVAQGRRFVVAGRADGVAGGSVELRDPGDAIVAGAPLDATGRFALEARARRPPVPRGSACACSTRAGEPHDDAILRSTCSRRRRCGSACSRAVRAPSSSTCAAGRATRGTRSRRGMSLSPGIELVDAPLELHADALRELDVLVADERGWAAAGAAEREAIVAAARDGMGLALARHGPRAGARRGRMARARAGVSSRRRGGVHASFGAGPDAPPALALVPLRMSAPEAAPLAAGDATIGWWRPLGRGRVALWRALDTRTGSSPRGARRCTASCGPRSSKRSRARARRGGAGIARPREPPGARGRVRLGDTAAIAGADGLSTRCTSRVIARCGIRAAKAGTRSPARTARFLRALYAHARGFVADAAADARATLALVGTVRADAPRAATDRRGAAAPPRGSRSRRSRGGSSAARCARRRPDAPTRALRRTAARCHDARDGHDPLFHPRLRAPQRRVARDRDRGRLERLVHERVHARAFPGGVFRPVWRAFGPDASTSRRRASWSKSVRPSASCANGIRTARPRAYTLTLARDGADATRVRPRRRGLPGRIRRGPRALRGLLLRLGRGADACSALVRVRRRLRPARLARLPARTAPRTPRRPRIRAWTASLLRLERWREPLLAFGMRLAAALFIVLVGFWIARRIARLVRRGIERKADDATLGVFLENLAYFTLVVVFIVGALDLAGVPTTSLLVGDGRGGARARPSR
jgi:hypothetical protein